MFSIPVTLSFSLWLPVAFPLAGSQRSRFGGWKKWNGDQNLQLCFSFSPLVWTLFHIEIPLYFQHTYPLFLNHRIAEAEVRVTPKL